MGGPPLPAPKSSDKAIDSPRLGGRCTKPPGSAASVRKPAPASSPGHGWLTPPAVQSLLLRVSCWVQVVT